MRKPFLTTKDGVELHGFQAASNHDKVIALHWLSFVLADGYTLERIDWHEDIGAGVAFLRPLQQTKIASA